MRIRISVMLAVDNAANAAAWYTRALGATELWSHGSVVALAIDGEPFLLHEPTEDFVSPAGTTTVRVEVFVDDPDTFVRRAIDAGADGAADPVRDHEVPWGIHRQGGFRDPFGHVWLVGDTSPLQPHSSRPDR
jgi:PhnB protein